MNSSSHNNNMLLPYMLAGYLFLLIFRPYEYWTILGTLRIERIYMLAFMAIAFVSPHKRFNFSSLHVVVGGFFLTLILSGLGALSGESAMKVIEDYLKYIIFYVMTILSIRDERDYRFILMAFIAVMGIYVGKSMWEFFLHGRYIYRMGIRRLVGIDITYGRPNAFAASICYSLPLLWALISSKMGSKWVRRGFWMYGVMALSAIILTGSRSGMVTALLFFMLVLFSSSRKVMGIILILVALMISWDFMPEDLQERFLSTFGYGDVTGGARDSAEGRMTGFLHGMDLFRQHPLFGIGPGNFSLSWPGVEVGHNAHNVYGQVAGELGLAGILTFGTMLVMLFVMNRRILKQYPIILRSLIKQADKAKSSSHHGDDAGQQTVVQRASKKRYRLKSASKSKPEIMLTDGPESSESSENTVESPPRYSLRKEKRTSKTPRYKMKDEAAMPEYSGVQDLADTENTIAAQADSAPVSSRPKYKVRKKSTEGRNEQERNPLAAFQSLMLYPLVSRAIIQTMILMLFKGWADHNLYRYTWLWLAALTILTSVCFSREVRNYAES